MEVKDIEYIDDGHLYLWEGVITPSVSAIIKFIFPNKYSNVPAHILQKACEFGTNVHNAIEMYEKMEPFELTDEERRCFYEYLELKEHHNIVPLQQEILIGYKGKYCGRLDMIGGVQDMYSLIDVKTTSKVDEESLAWQLGMYAIAYEYLYGRTFEAFYCLWLPKKGKGKLVPVTPKTKEEIERKLEEYEQYYAGI